MQVKRFDIEGPALIIPPRFGDARGYFFEAWKEAWFRENIADEGFVQDNQSFSAQAGTIRGLHFQTDPAEQGKLVRCVRGAIWDVAVDIRPTSSTFGKWIAQTLTPEGGEQLWVPKGFAHGFCTLRPETEVFYKVTNPYSKMHDKGVAFDDSDIGINWPINVATAILSDKDKIQPSLRSLRR